MKKMFNSLKSWIDVPFVLKPFIKRSGTGTKQFSEDVNLLCYPQSDNILITTTDGAEVTSSTQLYVDGTVTIKVTDNIVFEGAERPIKHIATYYRKGVPDIRVVYL